MRTIFHPNYKCSLRGLNYFRRLRSYHICRHYRHLLNHPLRLLLRIIIIINKYPITKCVQFNLGSQILRQTPRRRLQHQHLLSKITLMSFRTQLLFHLLIRRMRSNFLGIQIRIATFVIGRSYLYLKLILLIRCFILNSTFVECYLVR